MHLPFDENELYELVKQKNEKYKSRSSIHYLSAYQKIKNGKISFNWAAFFLGPLWLLYRKAYFIGSSILLIQFVGGLVAVLSLHPDVMKVALKIYGIMPGPTINGAKILSYALCWDGLLWGFLGNYIYFYFLREQYESGIKNIGTNKWMWLIAPIVSILFWGLDTLMIIIYSKYFI